MNVKAAAAYLGMSVSYLNKLRVFGGGPRYFTIGVKCVRYEAVDLDCWAREGASTSTSDPAPLGRASAKARTSRAVPAEGGATA
jgi:hypothetical protein